MANIWRMLGVFINSVRAVFHVNRRAVIDREWRDIWTNWSDPMGPRYHHPDPIDPAVAAGSDDEHALQDSTQKTGGPA